MSLLEKAKSLRKKKSRLIITKDHFDLLVAWVKEEITLRQVRHAIDNRSTSGGRDELAMLATILKESYHKGWVKF